MNAASTNPNLTQGMQGWLVSGGRVLASAEVAMARRDRRRGLIGRREFDGAFVLPHCRWIHTVGLRFPIDVAYLDADGRVIKTATMGRYQVGAPVSHAETVIEARTGAFGRWGLRLGDTVEVRTTNQPQA